MLTYNKPLNIRTSVKFDIKILLIIMILTFLLAYKLTDYAANFNTIQNESRIEIIFLAVFFIFLFIPMSHINQDEISINENRYLAKWRPFINKEGEINCNFFKNYNNWFNDRFNLRQFFTDVHTNITLKLTNKAKQVFIDKNGFSYIDFELNHYQLRHINKQDYDALKKFYEYLNNRNIELYVILTPYKGNIIYPSTQKILVKDEYEHNIDKEIKKLNKNNNMHIINPINEIKEASKNNLMYFKTEHHWTDDGAFIGYQELMKEITKKHPDIKVLKEQDFNFSYNTKIRSEWDREYTWGRNTIITNMPLNYKKKLHQTKYRYYTYKDYKLLETKLVNVPYRKTKDFYFPKGADYRVIVLGTSMSENLTEFIQYTFKHVHRIRINGVKKIPTKEEYKILKYYEKEIMDYHPNIIVLCISYNNILHLRNIF